MKHVADHELLMEGDGELEGAQAVAVRAHIASCGSCRRRQEEMMRVLAMTAAHHLEQEVPPAGRAEERLAGQMRSGPWQRGLALAAAAAALALLAVQWSPAREGDGVPRAALTPGAVRTASRQEVCEAGAGRERATIANGVAMEVFRKYGIHDPEPRSYEVDYLIPPELGGSEDERNLWPQKYDSGKWNSRVKDALEDRLVTMVCAGTLPLEEAQQAIARDWVGAYRRYFRTNEPLPAHVAFVKDLPWE